MADIDYTPTSCSELSTTESVVVRINFMVVAYATTLTLGVPLYVVANARIEV